MNNKGIFIIDITSPREEISFTLTCVSREESHQKVFYDRDSFEFALKEAKNLLFKGELICIRIKESTEHQELMILSEEENDEI